MSRIETIGNATLYLGDCREVLARLPDASVDSIVTDPPYGLSFMGNHWDYDVPDAGIWRECLRVLKPGGHLLAFAGTRTQHRMAVQIEDAGFEIRDLIAWVYGSGFPKSLDVSKAIDKAAGAEREVVGMYERPDGQPRNVENWKAVANADRNTYSPADQLACKRVTAPATDDARAWDGWGTALKPALEPITVARKPLAGTVAANVLKHGTGALNIGACRVDGQVTTNPLVRNGVDSIYGGWKGNSGSESVVSQGRWPANLIHDGSDEVVSQFPSEAGANNISRSPASDGMTKNCYSAGYSARSTVFHADAGSAARFFYSAKASRADRDDDNIHPTVKPTDLMRYLCRLVTPPGGVVLDPFLGSGSTGKAAGEEGFCFIGIEREPQYFDIACRRVTDAYRQEKLFV